MCTEPSNVKAGGGACPFRFRCAGCDHFRTDVAYLPDLRGYLDDLLRTRERLLASTDLDEWARAEAMPSQEEITRIRRLIDRISVGLSGLPDTPHQHVLISAVKHYSTGDSRPPMCRHPPENHRHPGVELHTPADVHYGHATDVQQRRLQTLAAARQQRPTRFTTSTTPKILNLPEAAWINQPSASHQLPPPSGLTHLDKFRGGVRKLKHMT